MVLSIYLNISVISLKNTYSHPPKFCLQGKLLTLLKSTEVCRSKMLISNGIRDTNGETFC